MEKSIWYCKNCGWYGEPETYSERIGLWIRK